MTAISRTKTASQQEKLQRLSAEVRALRRQLRDAQRLATVGTMAAMVSHELNNILTPIISYAQMARKNPALADKAIARAAEGGQRATSICKAILGMAADESTQASEINLRELTAETLQAMARDPAKDCIQLNVDIPPELVIRACRAELQQVLLNLLMNARAAVQGKNAGRQIDISARRRGKAVSISITDNGIGVAPQDVERIFQPFFTTRKAARGNLRGYGLGLTFCRRTVEAMGGQIAVESAPGRGSTFTVQLPA